VGRGLQCVVADKGFPGLYRQFLQAIGRYPDEAAQYDEAIRRQYEPRLRQKEEALSAQMGYAVRLDPFQDPDFQAFYKQNMAGLKAKYEGLIAQVRARAGGHGGGV